MTKIRFIAILSLVALLLSACNFPGSGAAEPTPLSQDAVYTAAAQTLAVQLTQNAVAAPTSGETPAAPPQESPLPPSDTPAPTDTATPESTATETLTPTAAVPIISASTATNCRRGPSVLYAPPIGVLNVNQTSEVHGRNADGTWWYIQNPANPSTFCWVWGETTSVQGSTTALPVITPPPLPPTATSTATPGASFDADFETVHDCGGVPTAIFKIDNEGGDLESLRLKIDDVTSSTTLFGPSASDAPFMGARSECPPGGDTLHGGDVLYIGGAIGSGNSGHTARATIRLCTEDDLDGVCRDRTVEFTIP